LRMLNRIVERALLVNRWRWLHRCARSWPVGATGQGRLIMLDALAIDGLTLVRLTGRRRRA
jgi:hypothetical protein